MNLREIIKQIELLSVQDKITLVKIVENMIENNSNKLRQLLDLEAWDQLSDEVWTCCE